MLSPAQSLAPRLPLEARPHGLQSRTQSHGHPGPWLGEGGQTLGKDFALALLSATKEFAHREVQLDLAPTTGDIAQHTPVVAMNG